nr:uncharacterized protein LOC109403282 [Aedes albopictus]
MGLKNRSSGSPHHMLHLLIPIARTVHCKMSSESNALSVEALDQEFESIVQAIGSMELSDCEIYKVFAPLRWHLFRRKWVKRLKLVAVAVVVALAVYHIPFLNWNASAVGRLAMIKVLPYWDWRPLYKERCLLKDFPGVVQKQSEPQRPFALPLDDCAVCENIDFIPKRKAVTYDYLNEHHLLRSLPVIISDSHDTWNKTDWENLTGFVESIEPLLLARPCNVQTNLIFGIHSSKTSENTMADLYDMLPNVRKNESWFLHFRNCQLKTVKRTRLLFEKPYFYPAHLEMPYTTWILMSNNYRTTASKELNLNGLIVLRQLKGVIRVTLRAKAKCDQVCSDLVTDIGEGQSLVYSTKLWMTEYLPTNLTDTSISFVTETYER